MRASKEIQAIADELILVSPDHHNRLTKLAGEVAILEWGMSSAAHITDISDELMRLGSLEGPLRT